MIEPERIVELSRDVEVLAARGIADIQKITRETKLLAINALIEAAHAGASGRGFSIVAEEVKSISERVMGIADGLSANLRSAVSELSQVGQSMCFDVRGQRLADLALHMIEIIDRNLYERSCDVRWWATDASLVRALESLDPATCAEAGRRLGVILDSYTVYLDIWIADRQGKVIACGRPGAHPQVLGARVADAPWFREALRHPSGDRYHCSSVMREPLLGNAVTCPFSAAVRAKGKSNGEVLGVIGVFFDWQTQANAVIQGVRLSDEERPRSRCVLIDADHRLIASSDPRAVLGDPVRIETAREQASGYRTVNQRSIQAWALTPGFETYPGMGWYGVIEQSLPEETR
ncbi:chemotaxis protein [Stutzerimonas nosocomialis]|uniref:Chemotaxis protein n=1 Tax=Stutzerimonas nosocomialis TaxID=1056496 RepID=A0A5R9QFA6_9GAMM|nr:methyl-accepting chemotaxis protein [Stutzerimonas nosocomialis]TLX55912.1 chemotaxis protein [Stutzerimonas nosocomialis]TLX63791.1 chemotaxis protein [Stutzerimonas nosocomialis]